MQQDYVVFCGSSAENMPSKVLPTTNHLCSHNLFRVVPDKKTLLTFYDTCNALNVALDSQARSCCSLGSLCSSAGEVLLPQLFIPMPCHAHHHHSWLAIVVQLLALATSH
jgi:ABC-type antimicrobial peptide transport system ATPase subunit